MYTKELLKNHLEEYVMRKSIEWFEDIFYDVMREEGWVIIREQDFFRVCYSNHQNIDDKCINLVKDYGWDVSGAGYIKEFDKNKITRNTHLLTADDLGLL